MYNVLNWINVAAVCFLFYLGQCLPSVLLPITPGFPGGSAGKQSACSVGDLGSTPGWEDPLEMGTATHSSILAWKITLNI